MKTDYEILQDKHREHLRQAISAGEYYTERDSLFHKTCRANGQLSGELLLVDQGVRCAVVLMNHSRNAMLVRYTDSRKRHWFAWIHA
jgi:hypothetical protein